MVTKTEKVIKMTNSGGEISLIKQIQELKEQRSAIILAHNYQRDEVQDIADFVGDSLELSQRAAQTDAKVIIFCGVRFMAETAAILSPGKRVLLPDGEAGCPLADMATAEQLRREKSRYPDATVVCYVNSSAEVKAESDYCCTSANATAIVDKLRNSSSILFVPDQHLGSYAATTTGIKLILWPGYCYVHVGILPEDIHRAKEQHPGAKVMVHPECTPEVIALADKVASTGGMCRYAHETDAAEIIVGTEIGMLHPLRKENPSKKFFPVTEKAVCHDMKLTTLEKILHSLQEMQSEVKIPESTRLRAKRAVERMVETIA